ncbi:putative aldouronate transport system substrate-binding protein [Catenibacillus scindens]|uniref:Putative aldouronate transport system substrate-binding protein n=1 Tax=Catenibacillus scindens TaxID=673271 RepID=A0A7W8HDK3_9FIRM|nr:extracellular solute-binding protein [Catenibacillus scindens]MBB5266359.1 putative aldouronate transport system substrate-binding protein [Catenibacillus scindens]
MNKKGRKWIAMALAGTMTLALAAGCGNSESAAGDSSAAGSTQAQAGEEAGASEDASASEGSEAAGTEGSAAASAVDWDDIVDINLLYVSMGPVPTGVDAVEAEINKITEEEINTHVNMEIIEIGSYDQQVNLKLSSSEPLDLILTMPGGPASFTTMRSQGQLQDISDLLEIYGQDILDTVGDLMAATTVDGGIYAVPAYRDLSSSEYIVMRTDVLEDLGLLEKAQNMTSMTEYEEIMDAVANSEKWSYLSPVASSGPGLLIFTAGGACIGGDKFADMTSLDFLGDTMYLVGVNPDGSDPTVKLTYSSDEYRAMYEQVKDWYDKGYVYKDSATESSTGSELIKSNVTFSVIMGGEYGFEDAQTQQCGMPVTCVPILSYPISTGSCTRFTWGVPSAAKEPEAAIAFLNMMYTDARINNLMAWGIEGVDYEVTDGIAHFIEGNENPAFHMADYLVGNQFLVTPWEGAEADRREIAKELTESAPVSAYLGFSADLSAVTNELSGINNVLAEFRPQIETGMASEDVYQDFQERLASVGADKIVAEYQNQLNAWLEAQ